jgi:ParB family transcriptional regulator, chromosome partitioning protein
VVKQVLGRGFESLIPINLVVGDVATPGEHIKNIELNKIVANPDQPRRDFDQTALQELSESIKQHGIIQPLVVTPYKDNYRIVAGERRFRASKLAGMTKVPVVIRNHEELEELEIALVENVQRVDLSPIEQALSIARLHDQFSMSFRDIARKLGKAETTVSNIVRLLQLPEIALEALRKNHISEGHARAILSLKTDEAKQKELLNKIITQGISVRQAEAFAKSTKLNKPTVKSEILLSPKTHKLLSGLRDSWKNKLTVKAKNASSGSVVFTYESEKELEDYLRRL